MGYELVAAALQPVWSKQLNARELLTLVAISHLARDYATADCPAGAFYAGYTWLCLAIDGRDFLDDPARRKTAHQAHRRALRRLEQVGAIETLRPATGHDPPQYVITTWQPTLPCA